MTSSRSPYRRLSVRVDSHLRLYRPALDGALEARIRRALELPNPLYQKALTYGRARAHLEERLVFWSCDGDELVLPRGFYRSLKAICRRSGVVVSGEDRRSPGWPVAYPEVPGRVTLRPYQREAVEAALGREQGAIVMPTGSGKTLVGLELVRRTGCRALWLTHTRELAHQTLARAEETLGLEGDQLGLIGDGRCRPGTHLTVALVQSLRRRSRPMWSEGVGAVICDEAHHAPAFTFREVIQPLPARYRFGLTATPDRSDGLGPLLHWILGPPVVELDLAGLFGERRLVRPRVVAVETGARPPHLQDYATMLTRLLEDEDRNDLILRLALSCTGAGRRLLLLSDRVAHCEALHEALRRRRVEARLLVGRTRPDERAAISAEIRAGVVEAVVATTRLVGEGWDQPRLDTVVLTSPMRSPHRVQQAVGRVMRPAPDKRDAWVVELVDDSPLLRHQFQRRCAEVYLPMGARLDPPHPLPRPRIGTLLRRLDPMC